MRKRWQKVTFWTTLLILFVGFFLPLPVYLETPGEAEPLAQFVRVAGKHDRQPGKYMLTTVRLQQARPFTYLWFKTRPFTETISKDQLMGDASNRTFNQMQDYYMQTSINDAIKVAYQHAGESYHKKFLGIYVMSILKQSPFKSDLAIGDTITKIDGHQFKSARAFIHYVKRQRVGQKVSITYQHHKTSKIAKRPLMKLPQTKHPGLGIGLVDHTKVQTKIPVKVKAGDIGGPSAGLMFTLAIYDQLSGQHLRHGRRIAGTGTMSARGKVGPIGGIDKKVVAANRAGASVFFAPDHPATKREKQLDPNYQNNYQVAKTTAKQIHSHMKIVPVKQFTDVLAYLKK